MVATRKTFKQKLKWCQANADQIKMDIIASSFKQKLQQVLEAGQQAESQVENVDDISGPANIAELFRRHFQVVSIGTTGGFINVQGSEKSQ